MLARVNVSGPEFGRATAVASRTLAPVAARAAPSCSLSSSGIVSAARHRAGWTSRAQQERVGEPALWTSADWRARVSQCVLLVGLRSDQPRQDKAGQGGAGGDAQGSRSRVFEHLVGWQHTLAWACRYLALGNWSYFHIWISMPVSTHSRNLETLILLGELEIGILE